MFNFQKDEFRLRQRGTLYSCFQKIVPKGQFFENNRSSSTPPPAVSLTNGRRSGCSFEEQPLRLRQRGILYSFPKCFVYGETFWKKPTGGDIRPEKGGSRTSCYLLDVAVEAAIPLCVMHQWRRFHLQLHREDRQTCRDQSDLTATGRLVPGRHGFSSRYFRPSLDQTLHVAAP